jgi:LuxR family maltose regulon positive regulatory protein
MAVLATKLHVPAPRRRLVPRPRLVDRLSPDDARWLPRLVLVSAPAGFGKTTLLAQWLASGSGDGTAAAWLSLDPGDNDVRRFLTHLVASVRTLDADVGAETADLLAATERLAAEPVLTTLVNELDQLPGQVVLALDDYHVLEERSVHEAVAFLLEHAPPQVSLVVATRSDPPLPLARLRGRAELVEVRAADLRFTASEADTLLGDITGLELDQDQVTALTTRTEGWAAGLQLAALSLREQGDAAAFVEAFAGSHRFVLDYLVEEVLHRESGVTRRFLLDTAVLTQLSAPLCDAVTGRTDSRTTLADLERRNLFVVPLDDDRGWYRYHHLFAEALRARLGEEDPDRVPLLHRAASEWYADHGLLEDALRHAIAGDHAALAADLVEQALPDARRRRQDRTLRGWLDALPEDLVRVRPLLSTQTAWARLVDGDLDGVEARLRDAEQALAAAPEAASADPAEVRALPATIEMYRASVAQARGDAAGTASHARRALDLAGPDHHAARAGGAGFLGLSAWAAGDLDLAVETFTQAVDSLHAAGSLADELGSTVVLAEMWLARGRPLVARQRYERALRAAQEHPALLSTTGDLHVGLAGVLVEQHELASAEEHLRTGAALGEAATLLENRHRWHVSRARLLRARGDLAGAADHLQHAATLYLPGFFPDVRPLPAALARIRIAQGRLDEATGWAEEHAVTPDGATGHLSEYDHLTLARLLVARHRADGDPRTITQATGLLDRLLLAAAGTGRGGSSIEIHLVRALAEHARGRLDEAVDELTRALTDAVPAGYVQLFLDEGDPLVELLRLAEPRPGAAAHARRLLRAATATPDALPAPEGLSEREVEVLRLLATSLSGPEIARQLFMSVNTFRTHTKHIFTKLEVRTRRAAVLRAADLHLL